MGLAVLTILVSVLAGTLLALLPRQKGGWMGPMRTFGLCAALAVVGLHMVPESIESIGPWALLALSVGLVLPALLGRLGSFVWRARSRAADPRHVALEAGYAGLLVHKVGDGVALGVYAGDLHPGASSHGFATALAAHIVPVVAIVVLTFDSVRGRGSALRRALGLALAGLLGVFLTHSVALAEVSVAHGWLSAIAAGMLLHVVMHDLGQDLPKGGVGRALDFSMAVLGFWVSALGGQAHAGHQGESMAGRLEHTLFVLLACTVPPFFLGSLAGRLPALMRGLAATGPRSPFAAAVDEGMRLYQPILAFETLLIAAVLLGWPFMLVLGVAGVVLGFGAGALVARSSRSSTRATTKLEPEADSASPSWSAFEERVLGLGALVGLGVFVAALVEAALSEDALRYAHGVSLPAVLFFLLVAGAASVCAPATLPVVLVLVDKGLPPGLAVTALLLGPLLNRRAVAALREARGASTAGLLLGVGAVALFGLGVTATGVIEVAQPLAPWDLGLGGLALGGVSAALCVGVIYRSSVRGFLLPLERAFTPGAESGEAAPSAIFHHGHALGDGHLAGEVVGGELDHPSATEGGIGLDAPRTGLKIPGP